MVLLANNNIIMIFSQPRTIIYTRLKIKLKLLLKIGVFIFDFALM